MSERYLSQFRGSTRGALEFVLYGKSPAKVRKYLKDQNVQFIGEGILSFQEKRGRIRFIIVEALRPNNSAYASEALLSFQVTPQLPNFEQQHKVELLSEREPYRCKTTTISSNPTRGSAFVPFTSEISLRENLEELIEFASQVDATGYKLPGPPYIP